MFSNPRLAILFWYYKDPELCADRVADLRKLNPGTPIHGLFGGDAATFEAFQTRGLQKIEWVILRH